VRLLFAIGAFGSVTFVLALLHVPLVAAMAIALVVAVISAFVEHRLQPVRPVDAGTPHVIAAIPIVIVAINIAIVPLHDFDGRAFWLLKAKAIAHERSIDGPFFHGRVMGAPRNQYPLMMPIDAAALMIANGSDDDRHVRWLYLGIFAALVWVVARYVDPWCAAILAWLPQFAVATEGGALSAYSDIAIAAFVTCAFLEMIDGESPMRFGCWLAFLVLTKNEGLPVALILFAIGLTSFRKRWARMIVPLALAIAALFAWRAQIPKTDEEDYIALLPSLPSHLRRLVPALLQFARHAFTFSTWGVFWIAAAIALVILAWRSEWRAPAIVVAMCAVYIAAFMVTKWKLDELIDVSADRLLMHMAGPALFAIARVTDGFARNRYSPREHRPKAA